MWNVDFVIDQEDVLLSSAIPEDLLPPGVVDVDPLLAGDDGSVTLLLPDLLVGVCYWGPPGAEDG